MAPPRLYRPVVHTVIVVVEELVVKEPAGTVVQTVEFAPEYVPEGLQRQQQNAGGVRGSDGAQSREAWLHRCAPNAPVPKTPPHRTHQELGAV
jgi:hypothetical protein